MSYSSGFRFVVFAIVLPAAYGAWLGTTPIPFWVGVPAAFVGGAAIGVFGAWLDRVVCAE